MQNGHADAVPIRGPGMKFQHLIDERCLTYARVTDDSDTPGSTGLMSGVGLLDGVKALAKRGVVNGPPIRERICCTHGFK